MNISKALLEITTPKSKAKQLLGDLYDAYIDSYGYAVNNICIIGIDTKRSVSTLFITDTIKEEVELPLLSFKITTSTIDLSPRSMLFKCDKKINITLYNSAMDNIIINGTLLPLSTNNVFIIYNYTLDLLNNSYF